MPILSISRLAAALYCLCLPALGAAASEPVAAVNEFDAVLLDAMKNAPALGPKGRYERLAPVMREKFDLAAMTHEIAGAHWNRLDDGQKAKLVESFSRFEVAIFADWFDLYEGQSFQVKDVVTRNDEIATIGVDLAGAAKTLRLEYVLRADAGGAWRIVDVRYEGWMSTVERRRSEFADLFGHEGYDVLLARLDKKGAELLDHADNPNSSHLKQPLLDLWKISFSPIF